MIVCACVLHVFVTVCVGVGMCADAFDKDVCRGWYLGQSIYAPPEVYTLLPDCGMQLAYFCSSLLVSDCEYSS